MSPLRAADHYDLARIRDWIAKKSADTVTEGALVAEEQSLASRLCAECIRSFRYAVKISKSAHELPLLTRRSLERSGSSMTLWAEGYGVVEGKLNDVLSVSRPLERSFLRLLKSIGNTLSRRLIPKLVSEEDDVHKRTSLLRSLAATAKFAVQESRQGSDSGDSDSDASSVSDESDVDLGEIADDLRTDIDCLIDLEPLIKTPFIQSTNQKETDYLMPQLQSWTPEKTYLHRTQIPKGAARSRCPPR